MMMFLPGFMEILVLLGGGGLVGMPPGALDPQLRPCAPSNALVYTEWAERSEGHPGAGGVDGLVADPEIRAFVEQVKQAAFSAIEREVGNEPTGEAVFLKVIPELVLALGNQPGCFYVTADVEKMSAAVKKGQEDLNQPFTPTALAHLKVALIVNAGKEADRIEELIGKLLDTHPLLVRTENLQKQTIPIPLPDGQLMIHREGQHFILGFGAGVVDEAIAGLNGHSSSGLAQSERFQSSLKQLSMDRVGLVSWIDVKGLQETAQTVMGDQGAIVTQFTEALGLVHVDHVMSVSGVVQERIHTRTLVKTDGSTEGLLALAAGRSITDDDFELIPADADFVEAISLDPIKILEAIRTTIRTVDPESLDNFNGLINQFESELGVSLEDELFVAFGQVVTIYDSPSGGGLLVTGLLGSFEVKDPEKAQAVFTEIMKVVKQAMPADNTTGSRVRGMRLARHEFMGREIYFINTIGESDMPFAPAFCLTDRQLLVAPHPQAIKSHLRFLKDGGPNFREKYSQVKKNEGEMFGFTWVDTKALGRYLYAIAPYLAQLAYSEIQSQNVQVDLFSFPSARAILPYFSESEVTVRRTEQGVLLETANGIPVPGSTSMLANPVIFLFFQVRAVQGF